MECFCVILYFCTINNSLDIAETICFVGATPNFFKIGYTAIRAITEHYPGARMRLGLISEVQKCPPIVRDLQEAGTLSYHTWPLGDKTRVPNEETGIWMSAEMDGLVRFFSGCREK